MLADLQARGLLETLDVELAQALGRMVEVRSPEVELAIALTSRSVRRGHSCFPLDMSVREIWPGETGRPGELPDAGRWKDQVAASALSDGGPLVLDEAGRLYLRRYWQLERDIALELARRSSSRPHMTSDPTWLQASLERLFPGAADSPQRVAARNAGARTSGVVAFRRQ